MCLLVSANDLISLYLSLEFLSLTSYILAGYLKESPRSNEAAIKYFLYGAVSAAIMLYGLSLLYGMTGKIQLEAVIRQLSGEASPLATVALTMVATGFFFKVAVAPFHQWSPDIYEGAPTPVTAFLSVAPKAAGFGALIRVFMLALPDSSPAFSMILALLAALTMTWGNLAALPQTNLKRMLAYSSIAQAGYVLMGISAAARDGSRDGMTAALLYLATYLFMNLGIFGVAIAAERMTGSEQIPDYAGFRERNPALAWMMILFLLSLAGLPPTAGFIGKFYLFVAVLKPGAHLAWLAMIAAANTAISVYYYFNVARTMFFAPPATTKAGRTPLSLQGGVAFAFAMTLLLGILPSGLIFLAQNASLPLGGPH
jgi:proton-translocating NADH-quinone oxidoreductase chain N